MEVKVREKCSQCNGAGFIEHPKMPAFRAAWDKFKEDVGRDLVPADVDKILLTLGVTHIDHVLMGERCEECNMYGWKESWISVDDLTNPIKQILK